ncbi:hypothetical protein Tco_0264829 [Tanacetum coccineum]
MRYTRQNLILVEFSNRKIICSDSLKFLIGIRILTTNTSSSKSDEKRRSPREEEQVFLDDLARLQRQEKEANEEAEALIRNHDQDTESAVDDREGKEEKLKVPADKKVSTEEPSKEENCFSSFQTSS